MTFNAQEATNLMQCICCDGGGQIHICDDYDVCPLCDGSGEMTLEDYDRWTSEPPTNKCRSDADGA